VGVLHILSDQVIENPYRRSFMDSYVVRIYRRSSSSPQNLVGLVELVEVNQERVFSSFDELRAILSCRQGCAMNDGNAGEGVRGRGKFE
jgi:hypothetical protein